MVRYIAIEREYASGGSAVARQLSRETGFACYGREILEQAAKELHIPVSQLEQYEEQKVGSLLYSITMIARTQAADPDLLLKDGRLFVAEQMAIRELADRGPAIFLGHCAAQALKDRPGVLRVFIRCDPQARRERAVKEYGIAPSQADQTIHRFDRKREGYYQTNTGKKWRDPGNYDVILDSSALGTEGCTAALCALTALRQIRRGKELRKNA